jgi:hypothetical protein
MAEILADTESEGAIRKGCWEGGKHRAVRCPLLYVFKVRKL